MATVRASCPDCGDVELTHHDVNVRVCLTDDRGTYNFRCPKCRMRVSKGAERWQVDLLVASGATLVNWLVPKELQERREATGPVISHDDLIDAHKVLNNEARWEEALRALK